MYAKAIYVEGRVVTGRHHGEAFGLLSEEEKCSDSLLSGFYDEKTGRFFCDGENFYTKSIYLVRHAKPSKGYDEDHDPDLSPEGLDKAHLLASHLLAEEVSEYTGRTSPYLRCLIMADIISRKTGMAFMVDPRLVEPAAFDILLDNHASEFPQFTWPTGDEFRFESENEPQFMERLEDVARTLEPKSVVVSHHTPIKALAHLATGHGENLPQAVPVASVTYIHDNVINYFGKTF